ncbi:TrlF family AAA-like ATPase [Methylocystis sp.]|uniref:TrlF family AAA-like ATPase n=1 Tax=Methylocystis sp. TaxID=1911079 RepID=UPI003DA42E02
MALPDGARFYRCALQLNPFGYLKRHAKPTPFQTEEEYNEAMVATCLELGIEIIAVTDHYRVHESASLLKKARESGLLAFGGFEAVAKDGVHFLCLFDPDKDSVLERFIGECGIHNQDDLSPTGTLDSLELLQCTKRWGSVCIAAHVAADGGGLLKKLSGQTRMAVWKSPELLACALAGPVSEAPDNLRPILENKDAQHRRERMVAVINAQDVNGPDDLRKAGSSCFIKMSEVSMEGLRQAFLDPESRVRLASDPAPEPHAEFIAMSWEGGFLRETSVHFNPNLNVLVGGRGTGKSTMVESLRYVLGLEPVGEDARKAHEGVVKQVLKSGTKISLLVRSHKPSPRCYTIERTVPNPAIVRDESGTVLSLGPRDVMPGVEVFGQHEISELTKSREKLTLLLERFIDRDSTASNTKSEARQNLQRSRSKILELQREIGNIDDRLTALPGLEETLKRFQEAGLEERLKEKSQLVSEEAVIKTIADRLAPVREISTKLSSNVSLDLQFLSSKALENLPNAPVLAEAEGALNRLSERLKSIAGDLEVALKAADNDIAAMRTKWDERRKVIEATYEQVLRELQKSKIDGAEFIRLRQQIEELRPLRERRDSLVRDLSAQETERRQLLATWEDAKATEYRAIAQAAKKVSRKLRDRVRVEVTMSDNREPLERLLRDEIGGNLTAAMDRLRARDQISLPDLAARCREGKDALIQHFGLPAGAAERIAQGNADLFMQIEELELPATTKIELNTAAEGESPVWQALEDLSTGQKATAVLLLLLLESESPLVVDQPEDDLDNRFITDGVVPIMRQEKQRRQFVFSTHNANIPVLGDAELILGLGASGEGGEGKAMFDRQHMGSIDCRVVRELVEEILEGGKAAFEMRRLKYGF